MINIISTIKINTSFSVYGTQITDKGAVAALKDLNEALNLTQGKITPEQVLKLIKALNELTASSEEKHFLINGKDIEIGTANQLTTPADNIRDIETKLAGMDYSDISHFLSIELLEALHKFIALGIKPNGSEDALKLEFATGKSLAIIEARIMVAIEAQILDMITKFTAATGTNTLKEGQELKNLTESIKKFNGLFVGLDKFQSNLDDKLTGLKDAVVALKTVTKITPDVKQLYTALGEMKVNILKFTGTPTTNKDALTKSGTPGAIDKIISEINKLLTVGTGEFITIMAEFTDTNFTVTDAAKANKATSILNKLSAWLNNPENNFVASGDASNSDEYNFATAIAAIKKITEADRKSVV